MAGVSHRHVEVNGVRIHVAEAGAGEPLVLQHGWPQNWYEWRHLIPELAGRYRVICPDLRGFGWSDAPRGRYDLPDLADELLALLDVLNLERVRLVGHDWGGYIGCLACLSAPERFERFAALSIISPWWRPPVSPLLVVSASYQFVVMSPVIGPWIGSRPEFVKLVHQVGAADGSCFTEDELKGLAEPFRDPARGRATAALYRGFQLRELPRLFRRRYAGRRAPVPMLGLWGDHDPLITESSFAGMAEHAESFRAEKLAGVGHFVADEAPEALLERLVPFLE